MTSRAISVAIRMILSVWFVALGALPAGSQEAAPGATPVNPLTLDLGGGLQMEFVLIRPGKFTMGAPGAKSGKSGGHDEEKPAHEVTISQPFYMGTYPVTQEQWQALMGNNPSAFKGPKHPVETVSWNDAQDFCKKMSEKTGRKTRLPTEAEWEYACRAGSTAEFFTGNGAKDLADYAWFGAFKADAAAKTTHPVGEKKPHPWGFYDMQGNVTVWCQDWYDETYYDNSPKIDPQGPPQGAKRAGRGGSWFGGAWHCGAPRRLGFNPEARQNTLGLRVVVSAPQ